jgi:hypothetical protein
VTKWRHEIAYLPGGRSVPFAGAFHPRLTERF